MERLDGQKQRNALTAAEQALRALAAGKGRRALQSAERASELDQLGMYADLPAAVSHAARSLETGEGVTADDWRELRATLSPGPLQALVDSLAG